jgi:transposase
MALELSDKSWKLGFSNGSKVRERNICARDCAAVVREVSRAKERLGLPADAVVVSCYEAGRDGFWIHRFLTAEGIENLVVDPSSIEVNRRKRRAKTDRLDVKKLLRMLMRYRLYDEKTVWKVVHVPSEEQEDELRLHRERERLKKERTGHITRIRSLLALHGIRVGKVSVCSFGALRDWRDRPLPAALLDELEREKERLLLAEDQIELLEKEKRARLKEPRTAADAKAGKLFQLRGVGETSAWVLGKEFFGWRDFKNRRQVGALSGLTGTPYDSGGTAREQGISKAGNKRVRAVMIELAWSWLRFQPHSELSKWFEHRFGRGGRRMRRIGIVALARKLLVALWKYVEKDELPAGLIIRTGC